MEMQIFTIIFLQLETFVETKVLLKAWYENAIFIVRVAHSELALNAQNKHFKTIYILIS